MQMSNLAFCATKADDVNPTEASGSTCSICRYYRKIW